MSGADGAVIWEHKSDSLFDLYNVIVIEDVNYDGYKDILASYYTRDSSKFNVASLSLIPERSFFKILRSRTFLQMGIIEVLS